MIWLDRFKSTQLSPVKMDEHVTRRPTKKADNKKEFQVRPALIV